MLIPVRWAYPVFLTVVSLTLFRRRLSRRIRVIRQRMIDAEYVVEERVENYDSSKETAKVDSVNTRSGKHDDEDGEWVDEVESEGEDAGVVQL